MDWSHEAKARFGDGKGDTWGDVINETFSKVVGKGFRKEMQKAKKASWRGAGEINQAVLSTKFEDSSDDE